MGSIKFIELKPITSLAKRVDGVFLGNISNFFDDVIFSLARIISQLNYANAKQQSLFSAAE